MNHGLIRRTVHAGHARRVILLALLCSVLQPSPALAQRGSSDAVRLGSFAGAMRFCEERFGGSERRYRMARLRVAGVISDMDSRDKYRALAARDRAYERGQFLGEKLDRQKCNSLLKLSEWQAYTD